MYKFDFATHISRYVTHQTRAGGPETVRPEPHDLVGAGVRAILFFLQEPEHFKKLELCSSNLQQFLKIL